MKSRREVVVGYVEFVAACRVMGFSHLLKGNAPSIERMIRTHNNKRRPGKKGKTYAELPFPPLDDMIAAKEQDFARGLLPDELQERVTKWASNKREANANA